MPPKHLTAVVQLWLQIVAICDALGAPPPLPPPHPWVVDARIPSPTTTTPNTFIILFDMLGPSLENLSGA